MTNIEIDSKSGFCFGVTTAIKKAEEELANGGSLYCLGDIVHNSVEMERLRKLGLITIDHEMFGKLHNTKVLLRAHGEPPETYETAKRNNIEIIDATCPVVLNLQKKIKHQYKECDRGTSQIVIYGKRGHAEVLGLVGQTEGNAKVIQSVEEATKLDLSKNIYLYSQTTKSLEGFREVTEFIKQNKPETTLFDSYDTICRQVANRMTDISKFADSHELIYFVSGKKSSNGKMLYDECLKVNPNTIFIEDENSITKEQIKGYSTIGICGATSTPKWLMENVMKKIKELMDINLDTIDK